MRATLGLVVLWLCALTVNASCSAGGGGGNQNLGSGWSDPFVIGPAFGGYRTDVGMDSDGNVLATWWDDLYATYHEGIWTTGTHGLRVPSLSVGASGGLLVGEGEFSSTLLTRRFANGVLTQAEILVETTSSIGSFVPIHSEHAVAVIWEESAGRIAGRVLDAQGAWTALPPLATSADPVSLLAAAIGTGRFLVVWEESDGNNFITRSSELSDSSWRSSQALGTDDPIALAPLSDGRAVLVMDTGDGLDLLVYDVGSGWSAPTHVDLSNIDVSIQPFGEGEAFVASPARIVHFDGITWGDPIDITEAFDLDEGTAFRVRSDGSGFAFGLCKRYDLDSGDDVIFGQPCLGPFGGGAFGSIDLIGDDLEGYGRTSYTGAALNESGKAIITWTAPLDLTEPFSDTSLWAMVRE